MALFIIQSYIIKEGQSHPVVPFIKIDLVIPKQVQIEAVDNEMSSKLMKLQAAIKYGEEDLAGAKSLVDQVPLFVSF